MKIGTENKFTIPNECPIDCIFKDDIKNHGQNSICYHCPVMCCKMPLNDEEAKYMPIVHANEYRNDWAEQWERFFNTGEYPLLKY